MKKAVFQRLFKLGRLPRKLLPVLEAEGLLVCDEGISGWLITRDVHGPGKSFKQRLEGFSGFLAITRRRVVSYTYWKPMIDLPLDPAHAAAIDVRLVGPNQIELSFPAEAFNCKWSGTVTLRFNTRLAREFHDTLVERIATTQSPPPDHSAD